MLFYLGKGLYVKGLEMRKSFWNLYIELESNQPQVSLERKDEGGWHRQKRKRQYGHVGGNWSDAAGSQGMPTAPETDEVKGPVIS